MNSISNRIVDSSSTTNVFIQTAAVFLTATSICSTFQSNYFNNQINNFEKDIFFSKNVGSTNANSKLQSFDSKSDTIIINYDEKVMRLLKFYENKLNSMVSLDLFDSNEEFEFLNVFKEIDENHILYYFSSKILDDKNDDLEKALLIYYSTLPKENIDYYQFIIVHDLLKNGDVYIQEKAIDTILAWDYFPEKERLRDIKIKNKYLQRYLDDFINGTNKIE